MRGRCASRLIDGAARWDCAGCVETNPKSLYNLLVLRPPPRSHPETRVLEQFRAARS
jgi:hypothetical protein